MITDDLRKLLAEATPGPWSYSTAEEPDSYLADVVATWRGWIATEGMEDPGLDLIPSWINSPRVIDLEDDGSFIPKADAMLAVEAVNVLPRHLDVVEAARALSDALDAPGPRDPADGPPLSREAVDEAWEVHGLRVDMARDVLRAFLDKLETPGG